MDNIDKLIEELSRLEKKAEKIEKKDPLHQRYIRIKSAQELLEKKFSELWKRFNNHYVAFYNGCRLVEMIIGRDKALAKISTNYCGHEEYYKIINKEEIKEILNEGIEYANRFENKYGNQSRYLEEIYKKFD